MKKTIQPSPLNSKVGRTYALNPIYAQEARPQGDLILDMTDQEAVPIRMEEALKPW
ncbi:MAG TPA: hypothetical protein VLZ54_13560 [Arenibacter sp.]|nr:hypothetical protein [Arenibacter sp.]